MADLVRITKLMSERGMCSRREAERLIDAGAVMVDGQVVREQGVKATRTADIQISGRGANWMANKVTVVLNKPMGIVSTQPEGEQVAAWTLLTAERLHGRADEAADRVMANPYYLNVAGRLDRDSHGLLVLSTDGLVVKAITGGSEVAKTYLVRVDGQPSEDQISRLRGKLVLDGKKLRPMAVTRAGRDRLRFELTEGRKHQIRRVCQLVGLEVVDLQRTAVGAWKLDDLPSGHWRVVPQAEVAKLITP